MAAWFLLVKGEDSGAKLLASESQLCTYLAVCDFEQFS